MIDREAFKPQTPSPDSVPQEVGRPIEKPIAQFVDGNPNFVIPFPFGLARFLRGLEAIECGRRPVGCGNVVQLLHFKLLSRFGFGVGPLILF